MSVGGSEKAESGAPDHLAQSQGTEQPAGQTTNPSSLKGSGWSPVPNGDSGPPSIDPAYTGNFADGASGEVRDFRERTEQVFVSLPLIVWTFRLEQYDEAGNPYTSVPVVMRGRTFNGYLGNGNLVEVRRFHQRGNELRVDLLYNVTTNSWVVAKGYGPLFWFVGSAMAAMLVLIIFIGIWAYRRIREAESNVTVFDSIVTTTVQAALTFPDGAIATTDTFPATTTEEPPPDPIVVSCTTTSAGPVDAEAEVGQAVQWVNQDSEVMEFDLGPGLPDPAGQQFAPGEFFETSFDEPGIYGYTCVYPTVTKKQSGDVVVLP